MTIRTRCNGNFPAAKSSPAKSPSRLLPANCAKNWRWIGRELFRTRHRYRESLTQLELIFYQARVDRSASLKNLVFEKFEWAKPSELLKYDFLKADEEFVARLASRAIALDA